MCMRERDRQRDSQRDSQREKWTERGKAKRDLIVNSYLDRRTNWKGQNRQSEREIKGKKGA